MTLANTYYDYDMKNGDSAIEINIIQDVGLYCIYLFWQQILQLIFLNTFGAVGCAG